MQITLSATPIQKKVSSLQLFGIFDDAAFSPSLQQLDKLLNGYMSKLKKKGMVKGIAGSIFPIVLPDVESPILIVGLGKRSTWNAKSARDATVLAFKHIETMNVDKVTCYFTEMLIGTHTLSYLVRQITEAIYIARYRFDEYKSVKEPPLQLKNVVLHIPDKNQTTQIMRAVEEGIAISEGMTLTKNLGNMPSNVCTPTYLRDAAKQLAKQFKSLSVTVLDKKQMTELGMGALLGVAKGSAEPPYFIALHYQGALKKTPPTALVGKGITFDTGGNSLKPADSMVGMKYDMCGAATVLGTIKAVATLKLPINVIGIIAAVENMPGGSAYKPEDILKSLSGQTIEVISTDAEGRLILADALTYCERFKPDAVIDIATLTGAVVIALGYHATGLLTNDDALAHDLLKAGQDSYDRAWQLPLWDEYQEQIKSPFADMANTGGRAAGTITAACFLARFATKFRWAHLDVAGTAAMMSGTAERRATGRPVPLLVQYLINRANS